GVWDSAVRFPKPQLVGFVQFFKYFLFLFPVIGADIVGAFERHMLKDMRHARMADRFVGAAHIHIGGKADHGGYGTLNDNKGKPVIEGKFSYLLFKIVE